MGCSSLSLAYSPLVQQHPGGSVMNDLMNSGHAGASSAEYLANLIESNRLCIRIAEDADSNYLNKFLRRVLARISFVPPPSLAISR